MTRTMLKSFVVFIAIIFSIVLVTVIGYSHTDRVECEVPSKGKFVLESTYQKYPFIGRFGAPTHSPEPDYSARWIGIAGDQNELIAKSEETEPRRRARQIRKVVQYESPRVQGNNVSTCAHVGYFDGYVYALFYSNAPSGVLLSLATKQQKFMVFPSDQRGSVNIDGYVTGPGKFKFSSSTLVFEQSLFVVPCGKPAGDILSDCLIFDVRRFKSNTYGASWGPAEVSKKSELFQIGKTWVSQPSSIAIYPK